MRAVARKGLAHGTANPAHSAGHDGSLAYERIRHFFA